MRVGNNNKHVFSKSELSSVCTCRTVVVFLVFLLCTTLAGCLRQNAYFDVSLNYGAALVQFTRDEFRYTAGKYFLATEMQDLDTAGSLESHPIPPRYEVIFIDNPSSRRMLDEERAVRILWIEKHSVESLERESMHRANHPDLSNFTEAVVDSSVRGNPNVNVLLRITLGQDEGGKWWVLAPLRSDNPHLKKMITDKRVIFW